MKHKQQLHFILQEPSVVSVDLYEFKRNSLLTLYRLSLTSKSDVLIDEEMRECLIGHIGLSLTR